MAETPEPVFQIQRIYLKEVSLEQPNSPAILIEPESPSLEIRIDLQAAPIATAMYEVCVTATVHTKIKEKTVFLLEAKQAGIFEINHIPQEHMGNVLAVNCPQIVYPYLRSNVADLVQRAGFAPVHMVDLNFQHMHEQQQAQQAAQNPDQSGAPVLQ